MRYLRIFILFYFTVFLYSCSTIKEGFINQKKNSSDEFLVEKKSPLVMPPDYDDLLKPKDEGNKLFKNNKIEKLVNPSDDNNGISKSDDKKLEKTILKKIKKN